MDRKQLVIQTLAKAKKYQELARWIGDQETVHRILDLVTKLKRRAQVVAKPSQNRIRRRARQIWQENGCPPGGMRSFGSKRSASLARLKRSVDGR
jgi:hypothetical protein